MTPIDTRQPRPVWLYHGDVSWLYTTEDTPQRREALARLTDGFNRAPHDAGGPHGAIRVAITNAYYDARNAGETMEKAADNARDAVLAALGMPT